MNYYDTFIEVAEDCPVSVAAAPQPKGNGRTVPALQYEMIANHPYRYTQEDVLFEVFAERNGIADENKPAERLRFFSKDQACLRASALGKRYGWGIHNDEDGKVALYAVESDDYKRFVSDNEINRVKAMRSKRA